VHTAQTYFFAPGLGAGFAGCPFVAILAVPPSIVGFGHRIVGRSLFLRAGLGCGLRGLSFAGHFSLYLLVSLGSVIGSFDDPYFFAPGLGAGFAGCPLLAIFAVPPFVIGFGYSADGMKPISSRRAWVRASRAVLSGSSFTSSHNVPR
jgi:hypothetical protein